MSELIMNAGPSIVASALVGLLSAWLTAQKVLATYGVRLDKVEATIARMEHREIEQIEKLAAIGAKLDVLLGRE